MRLLVCVSATVIAVLLLASCGDDDGPSATPTPVRSPGETPETATPEPTHELFAEANKFDKDVLTAEPEQLIVLVLTNRDAGTHNVAVYTTPEAQEEIFVGETIDEADETDRLRVRGARGSGGILLPLRRSPHRHDRRAHRRIGCVRRARAEILSAMLFRSALLSIAFWGVFAAGHSGRGDPAGIVRRHVGGDAGPRGVRSGGMDVPQPVRRRALRVPVLPGDGHDPGGLQRGPPRRRDYGALPGSGAPPGPRGPAGGRRCARLDAGKHGTSPRLGRRWRRTAAAPSSGPAR